MQGVGLFIGRRWQLCFLIPCAVDERTHVLDSLKEVALLLLLQVRLLVTRPSHNTESFELPPKGRAVRAFTPQFPHPKDENW